MNDITVIKQLNKYNREQYYFNVNRNYLAELKKYIGDDYRAQYITKLLSENVGDRIAIEVHNFEEILKVIVFRADLNSGENIFPHSQFASDYERAKKSYIDIRGTIGSNVTTDYGREKLIDKLINSAVFEDNVESIINLINSIKGVINASNRMFKERDLAAARETVLESLRYILDSTQVMEYRSQYTKLLNEKPVDLNKVEAYLKFLQQIILADWKKQINDLSNYKQGDNFKFICHSTNSENFNGDFYSNLVSCSLLTEEFTDTYRSGFGFVFPPINIVGADGQDMHVKNYIDDEENMLNSTSVPKIESVGRVLDICREAKEANKKEGKKEKVYSEIVVKGFNPIGIFCFTVGDKELNHNHICAKRLQEQFPHLPIIEIDLTLYKSNEELKPYRDQLLFQLEQQMNERVEKKNSCYYDNYEYFWNNFFKLKQKGDYKVTDIISLYRENHELLNTLIDIKVLLSGKYNLDAIKYVLMYNYSYRIKDILESRLTSYDLMRLKDNVIDVIDNPLLEEVFPGLRNLIILLDKVGITNANIDEINKNQPITIASIMKILQLSINEQICKNKNELVALNSKKEELESSYKENENTLKKHQRYSEIINYEYIYSVANMELKFTNEQLFIEEKEKDSLLGEYEQMKLECDSVFQEKERLSKHQLLNYFKLRKLKSVLHSFKDNLSVLESKLTSKSEFVDDIKKDIADIRSLFKEKTGIDFVVYSEELSKATVEYDIGLEFSLPYTLQNISEEISKIDKIIEELTKQQDQLQSDCIRR